MRDRSVLSDVEGSTTSFVKLDVTMMVAAHY
jgi:hypothetical protein